MSFKGIVPPVITPFHEDGSIDRDGFVAMVEHLIGAGVHGIIIGGTTGEYYAQSRDERIGLLKLATSAAKRQVPLIAGVGAIRTEDCIDYALVARDLKFDGILIGSPYYAVPTQLELASHALAIGRDGRHADHALQLPGPYRNPYGPGIPE
jgi:4-hydroxy-tetrahydrodipicolinate synthase